jgi:hypothetical protein
MPKTIPTSADVRSDEEKPPQPLLRDDQKRQRPISTRDTIKMRMKLALPDTKNE